VPGGEDCAAIRSGQVPLGDAYAAPGDNAAVHGLFV